MADAPVSLVDQVNTIVSLLLALKHEVDPNEDNPPQANEVANQINSLSTTIAKLTTLKDLAKRLRNASTRAAALAEVDQIIEVEGGVALATFFKQVGTAVVQAQQALDAEFDRDLRAMQTSPPDDRLTPVQYAIPSVHAEMKVGFSQVSSRGINLLVFNNSQQKQNYSESTISFDVVAAPAPPNLSRIPPLVTSPEDQGGQPPSIAGGLPAQPAFPKRAKGALGFALPGVDDTGIELEAKVPPPPVMTWQPTFPLRDQLREQALEALLAKLSPTNRGAIDSVRGRVVIVPSSVSAEDPQSYLYLCPAAGGGRGPRGFRCYLADVDPSGDAVLRALRRPNSPRSDVLAKRGLVVPRRPTARDRRTLPDVLGGAGAAFMHLIDSALAFRPACTLRRDRPENAEHIATINEQLPEAVPRLVDGEPWAVFIDRGTRGARGLEYIVLRAVYEPGKREWREVHVIGVSPRKRGPRRTPHVHIPDVAALRALDSAALAALATPLEPLFERLIAIIDAS
jgi:hypothetical protein